MVEASQGANLYHLQIYAVFDVCVCFSSVMVFQVCYVSVH